jgi:hypothetical protein
MSQSNTNPIRPHYGYWQINPALGTFFTNLKTIHPLGAQSMHFSI